jgi:hypothetical protein
MDGRESFFFGGYEVFFNYLRVGKNNILAKSELINGGKYK